MKKTIKALAVLLVLAALAGGGFYVFKNGLPGFRPPPTQPPVPVPAETPAPVDLQPPVLSGETEAPQGGGAAMAQLVNMERTVKAKRASDLSWEDASSRCRCTRTTPCAPSTSRPPRSHSARTTFWT